MNEDESSRTSARTLMLPSGFFCPAIPVTLDEPSSIATIKSLISAIIYYLLFSFTHYLIIKLNTNTRIFIPASLHETITIEFLQTV